VQEVLLTALASALAGWTGADHVQLDVEGHGREALFPEVDLSRTVGWFTAVHPVVLPALPAGGWGERLVAVKEGLRALPHKGLGYGLLRHLSQEPRVREALRALPPSEVAFNYLGQLDGVTPPGAAVELAPGLGGGGRAPGARRPYLVDISGGVLGGRLTFTWSYAEGVHRRDTVERVARAFTDALRALLQHCQSPHAGAVTPSDFPLAKVNQAQLSKIAARLKRKST
jgi:non-ribosomal peptide synthase protein (TIGR01720 family)